MVILIKKWGDKGMLKKKKLVFSSLILVLIVMMFSGCSSSDPIASSETPTPQESQETIITEKFVITLSSHQTEQSPHQWVIDEFKRRIEESTDGNIEVKSFSGGQLGNARENIEGVQLGTIQMCLADTGSISNLVNDYALLQLPFIYRDYDHLNNVLKSDVVKDMDQKLIAERKLRPLGWYPDGLRNFISKKPIEKLSDFDGLKLRAMESDVVIDTINSLGANATPIPWGEVYTSIQTNVVSGMESAPTSIYAMKFYEVASNLTKTEHINLGVTLLIGEDFFASLPAEYQQSILEIMEDIINEQQARTVDQMETAIADLEKSGVRIIEIDKEPLIDAMQSVWTKFAGTVPNGQEIIDKIIAVK